MHNTQPVWFNNTIRHQIKCLRTLRRKTKQRFNLDKLKRLQVAEDKLQSSIITARVNFENKLINDFSKWKNYMIYRYIHNTTKTRSIPELLYFNTQCGSCDEENANLFNEFFYSVFTQNFIDPNNIDNLTSDVPTPLTELDFTQYKVYSILASLDVTKATGIDGIGPRILKNCALSLCFPLHLLFKKCLKQCVIPTEWATHIIIPVFKSGEKNLVNNYI